MKKLSLQLEHYIPDIQILQGKTILITGAANGLGRALSLACARHGATIVLSDKDQKQLEQVYDQIESEHGPQPILFPLNLLTANEEDYTNMAVAIEQTFGQLDGLILNAAVLGQHSPIVNIDFEQWQRALTVNLTANFLLLKHCAGLMNQAQKAACIYVSDQTARHGKAYWSNYACSKAGCLNLVEAAADEWEANTSIHVNSIDPGPMQTGLRSMAFPGEDPASQPTPETCTKPFLYCLDAGIDWPNGKHLNWDFSQQILSEN